MNTQNEIATLDAAQFEARKNDLVWIGSVDVQTLTHLASCRHTLIDLYKNATIVASLAYVLLKRRWDDCFYCFGNDIFIGLQQHHIFDAVERSAQTIARYVGYFQPWCDARFALVTAGVGATAEHTGIRGSASNLHSERLELQRCQGIATPSGCDLDSAFAQWVEAKSRPRWVTVAIGCAGCTRLQLRIPPRVQIVAGIAATCLVNAVRPQPTHDVVFTERFWAIETPTGDLYLIPDDAELDITEGVWFSFSNGTSWKLDGWYMVE